MVEVVELEFIGVNVGYNGGVRDGVDGDVEFVSVEDEVGMCCSFRFKC